jgi:hypothetical protein
MHHSPPVATLATKPTGNDTDDAMAAPPTKNTRTSRRLRAQSKHTRSVRRGTERKPCKMPNCEKLPEVRGAHRQQDPPKIAEHLAGGQGSTPATRPPLNCRAPCRRTGEHTGNKTPDPPKSRCKNKSKATSAQGNGFRLVLGVPCTPDPLKSRSKANLCKAISAQGEGFRPLRRPSSTSLGPEPPAQVVLQGLGAPQTTKALPCRGLSAVIVQRGPQHSISWITPRRALARNRLPKSQTRHATIILPTHPSPAVKTNLRPSRPKARDSGHCDGHPPRALARNRLPKSQTRHATMTLPTHPSPAANTNRRPARPKAMDSGLSSVYRASSMWLPHDSKIRRGPPN